MRFPNLFFSFLLIILLSGSATLNLRAQHFVVPNTKTGSDATILITTSSSPSINGVPLSTGDEIAVFSPGGLLTGMAVWNASNVSITVWGDNIMTEAVDGMKEGEVMSFSVWDKSENKEYSDVKVTYSSSSPFFNTTGKYTSNGIYSLASLKASSPNTPPIASDDRVTTSEDTPVEINVLNNDTGSNELSPNTVTVSSNPAKGTTSVNSTTGIITYTPEANFHGADEFTYTVKDKSGATSNAAKVTITIAPVNDAPVVSHPIADNTLTAGGDAFTIDVVNGQVFSDVDGDTLNFSATSSAAGIASVKLTGNIVTVTPVSSGKTTVTVTANDSKGGSVADQFQITVNAPAVTNKPPTVTNPIPDQSFAAGEAARTLDLVAMKVFSDPDGDALSLTASTANANVVKVSMSSNKLTLTPVAQGQVVITVNANDNKGGTVNDQFSVTISGNSNRAPIAREDQATTNEDVAVTIDVLANDSDPDGDQLKVSTLTILDKPAHGITRIDSKTGKITYEPAANYNGSDQFTYKISDSHGTQSAKARVSIAIKAVNDLPKLSKPIADQSLDLKDKKVFTIDLETAGIFVDVDGEQLTYTAQSSDNSRATAKISGSVLTITALSKGSVNVTLIAKDDSGGAAQYQFKVQIAPNAPAKGKVSGKLVHGNSSQPVKNIRIALKSLESIVDVDTTGDDGTFTFEIEDGDYQLEILGSGPVKGVTALDAAIVRSSLSAGKKPLSNLQERASDVNADGAVDLKDVHLIKEFAVGKVASFPAGTHFLNHETIQVSGVSSEVLTIGMFAVGDVDQSGIKQENSPNLPTQRSQSVNTSAGSAFSIPVFVDSDVDLGALMLEITYPGDLAELTGFSSPLQGVIDNVTENKVRLAWVGEEKGVSLDAGSTLLVLEFRALTSIEDLALGISSELADANATLLTLSPTLDPSVTTDTAQQEELPSEFALQGNYPNPFNPSTTIRFDLPQPADLQLQVFDLTGRQVAFLPTWSAPAGKNQEIQFEAGDMPSGAYLYRLSASIGGQKVAKTGQMLLLK